LQALKAALDLHLSKHIVYPYLASSNSEAFPFSKRNCQYRLNAFGFLRDATFSRVMPGRKKGYEGSNATVAEVNKLHAHGCKSKSRVHLCSWQFNSANPWDHRAHKRTLPRRRQKKTWQVKNIAMAWRPAQKNIAG